MGAGSYPAGVGPAGIDPHADPLPYVGPAVSPAALFSLESRATPLDANGLLVPIHPVDAAVTIALGFVLGSIPSAPNVGVNIDLLSSATPESALATANDVCRRALKALIDAGDVRLDSVELVGTPVRGRNEFLATYQNLRLPKAPPRGVRFS